MTMTPAQRRLRAQIGANTLHSRRDPRETTRVARDNFLRRFEFEVDPAGALAPEERARRAAAARRAYFSRLALSSSRSRRPRKNETADVPTSTASEEDAYAARALD